MSDELLKDFRSKNFVDQISILQTIEDKRLLDCLEGLCALITDPVVDHSVDFMIEQTLRTLLPEREDQILAGLASGSEDLVKICLQVAGTRAVPAAGPVLAALADGSSYPQLLFDVLHALSRIGAPDYLPVFRRHAAHANALIASLCIDMIGRCGDRDSIDILHSVIVDAGSDDRRWMCSLATVRAIEVLGGMRSERAVALLCAQLAHRNPTARRLIHEQVVARGRKAIPHIAALFAGANPGLKIMAARALGAIGDPAGAHVLIEEIENGRPADRGLLHAAYEALGRMPSVQARSCLLRSLDTDDSLLLLAAVRSLDHMCSGECIDAVDAYMSEHPERADAVLGAVATAAAVELFEGLYERPDIGERLIDHITALNDAEVIADFYIKLQFIAGERAERDAARLEHCIIQDTDRIILAIDHSPALLQFYRRTAADIGADIVTAGTPFEGLEYLNRGKHADLIIVQLDMPVMDGMEFARNVRDRLARQSVPILLTTAGAEDALDIHASIGGRVDVARLPFTADILKNKIENLLNA